MASPGHPDARTEVGPSTDLVAPPAPVLRPPDSAPGPVDPARATLEGSTFESRYEMRTLLGEGGMGEVRLCRDRRIGRDVAMKVVRASHTARHDVQARFLREA